MQNRADDTTCDTSGGVCASGQCVAACQAEERQTTCANTQCGPRPNNCGQTVNCGTCDGDMVCESRQCVCPAGTSACSATQCVKLQTDPKNCGRCENVCDGGNGTCKNGVCATPEVCDGLDNDLDGQIDEGTLCPANQVCRNGQCGCPAGTRDCDGDGNCEPLGTNEHCADCQPCSGGKVCQSRTCVCDETHCGDNCPCPVGTVCKGGLCVSDTTCVKHIDCPANQVCVLGQCAACDGNSCGNGCGCLGDQVCTGIGGAGGYCWCNSTLCGDNCTCDPTYGLVCEGGQCVYTSCVEHADCTGGGFCSSGKCVSDIFDCYDAFDCPVGQFCRVYCSDRECDMSFSMCEFPTGWTCQAGECVCLTGQVCGYDCCPAASCYIGPAGAFCA